MQSTAVTILWACLWTALRAIVPWTNVFVTGSHKIFWTLPGRIQLVPPSYVETSAALAQKFEHVLAHGCRDGTRKFCFDLVGCTTPIILIALNNFSGHSGSHRCFQFLASILNGFFEVLVFRVNEIVLVIFWH